jgi:hypothetical protein
MRNSSSPTSWSKWAGPLLALVFVAATLGLCLVLSQPETWRRRNTQTEAAVAATSRPGTGPDTAPAPIRERKVDEMTQVVESMAAYRGTERTARPLPMRPEPLKRWSDPANNVSDAAIWAWGERGRPLALVLIERFGKPGSDDFRLTRGIELVSLANEPLELEGSDNVRARDAGTVADSKRLMTEEIHWKPKPPGLTFRDVPHAPRPAQTAPDRLVQLNDLAKRFSAVAHPGRTSKLELLPEPADRYSDAKAGQIDGAIFLFAIGDNPEVIVLLEAQGPAPEQASWRYAIARGTAAPFEVAIDGEQVFTARYHSDKINSPNGSYYVVVMSRAK